MGTLHGASEPDEARRAATYAARTLRDAGHTAYFAGGCVRDELLGLHPTDYDIATDATPDEVRSRFRSTAHVGVSFGVVIVRLDGRDLPDLVGQHAVEVATFRADGRYSDRRRPDEVTYADEVADAHRRDFTINAMFLDPLDTPADSAATARGRLIDHVGGEADLRAGVVRAVGDPAARLAEDHLRALRGVRFAARFGFVLDPATAEAIARDAQRLAGVSRERIGDEVRRMLAHPSRARAVSLLRELGLEGSVLGAPAPDPAAPLRRLSGLPGDAAITTALAAWALDRAEDGAAFRDKLCLSNAETDELVHLIDGVSRVEHDWPHTGIAGRKRLAARSGFEAVLSLVAAADEPLAARRRTEVRELEASPGGLAPVPLVAGRDLIAAGLRPGPAFGRVLDRVYDAQLTGQISDRDEALELARRLLDEGP